MIGKPMVDLLLVYIVMHCCIVQHHDDGLSCLRFLRQIVDEIDDVITFHAALVYGMYQEVGAIVERTQDVNPAFCPARVCGMRLT